MWGEVGQLLRFGGPVAELLRFGGLRVGDDGRWSDQSHRRAGETRTLPPGSQTTVGRGDAEADGPSRWAGENGEARRCTGSPSVSQGSTAPPAGEQIWRDGWETGVFGRAMNHLDGSELPPPGTVVQGVQGSAHPVGELAASESERAEGASGRR